MCAAKENSVIPLKKIGIIAGNGDLPQLLSARLVELGYSPVLLTLGTDFSVGQAGKILAFFKDQKISDLVLVGGLSRPNWFALKMDFKGLCIVSKLFWRILGDDALLKIVRREIEREGFSVRGIQEFMPELLAPSGVMGKIRPDKDDLFSIGLGVKAVKQHGRNDKGQAVVVSGRSVLAKEGRFGTNALMKSVGHWGQGKILVKMSKPQQDDDLDLPTIGVRTVEAAYQNGFKGIVVEAGCTLIVELDCVTHKCDELGIFLIGVEEGFHGI